MLNILSPMDMLKALLLALNAIAFVTSLHFITTLLSCRDEKKRQMTW